MFRKQVFVNLSYNAYPILLVLQFILIGVSNRQFSVMWNIILAVLVIGCTAFWGYFVMVSVGKLQGVSFLLLTFLNCEAVMNKSWHLAGGGILYIVYHYNMYYHIGTYKLPSGRGFTRGIELKENFISGIFFWVLFALCSPCLHGGEWRISPKASQAALELFFSAPRMRGGIYKSYS